MNLPQTGKTRIDDVKLLKCNARRNLTGLKRHRFNIPTGPLILVDVPGLRSNRFCSSGIETIGYCYLAKFRLGMADCNKLLVGGRRADGCPMTG